MKFVDIDLVEEPLHLLRNVDTASEDFKGLVASMRLNGFKESEPLEVSEDSTGDSPIYIVIEGMNRLTAAKLVGLKQVPIWVNPKPMSDGERLMAALVANAARVKMKPVEYSRALAKLVEIDGGVTLADLARRACQTPAWVGKLLKLAPLPEEVGKLVDAGKITLANAGALAEIQKAGLVFNAALLGKAQRESVEAFAETASAYLSEHKGTKKAKPKGPVAKLRPLPDVKAELERVRQNHSMPAGYVEALSWTLGQDPTSAAAEGLSPVPAPDDLKTMVTALEKSLNERGLILESANETILSLRKQLGDANTMPGTYVKESGESPDLCELIHWALGSGADPAEVEAHLNGPARALLGACEDDLKGAIEAIGVKTLESKLKTNAVARWLKGERRANYSARRTILALAKDPVYAPKGDK